MCPSSININTDWLNQALVAYADGNRIVDCNIENIGDGKGFGGKTLRTHLTWNNPSKLQSVIVKLPIDDPDTFESMMFQGLLLREIRFYRELANDIDLDIPEIYYTELDGNDFAIVMEDLGEVKHRMLKPLDMAELKVALRSAAKLHAAFWNSPLLDAEWLSPVIDGTDESRNDNLMRIHHTLELLQESPHDTTYVENCVHKLLALMPNAPKTTPLPNPVTLVHGDFHGNNLHIQADNIAIFDWQLVAKGTPAMDVANLIVSSSEGEDYKKIVDHLLMTYHDALIAEGITNYSYKRLKRGFADAMFFTFLKFLVVVGTINYDVEGGEEMKNETIAKLNTVAKNADAKGNIKKLPFLFVIIRIINFFNRIWGWLKPGQKNA